MADRRPVIRDREPPTIIPFTDSIWYGVGCATKAGPREGAYFAAQAAGRPFRFVGTASFAGDGGGLAVNPQCECWPGIDTAGLNSLLFRTSRFLPRIFFYMCGINDIIAGASASDVVTGISNGVDGMAELANGNNWRIIVSPPLKSLNGGYDAVVQDVVDDIPAMIAGKSFAAKIIYDPGLYDCIPNPTIDVNMYDPVHPNDVGVGYMAARAYTYSFAPAILATRTT